MLVALIYFALSLALLAVTVAAFAADFFGPLTVMMSLAAMMVVFFIPHWVLVGTLVTLAAAQLGALQHLPGQLGLPIHVGCWILLLFYMRRMSRALPILDGTPVRDDDHPFVAGLTDDERRQLQPGRISWRPTITQRIPAMLGVEVVRGLVFREVGAIRLQLDVYRSPQRQRATAPTIMYIHGGAWFLGTRRQSRFMLYELAAAGFPVFAISYRFAPRFPLPSAIEDCKAALAWVRGHAGEFGARGDAIVAVGGSAGGHLTSMLALTPNLARFQPGFESADTRIQGAVVLYGVPDFVGPFVDRPDPAMALFLEQVVFRRRYQDDPELFRATSPVSYLRADAPPMMLVHGSHDHVVRLEESRVFAEKLRQSGAPSVHLLEVPLGQHAFEVFPSPLHQRAVRVIVRFLESL